MPVTSISQVSGFPVIVKGGKTIDCATIKITGPGGQEGKNGRMKIGLQTLLDSTQLLADLPAEDSHKTTDPATSREFWDAGGTMIVTRTVVCTDVTFDDTDYHVSLARQM